MLASNLQWPSWFRFPSAGIIDVCHQIWLNRVLRQTVYSYTWDLNVSPDVVQSKAKTISIGSPDGGNRIWDSLWPRECQGTVPAKRLSGWEERAERRATNRSGERKSPLRAHKPGQLLTWSPGDLAWSTVVMPLGLSSWGTGYSPRSKSYTERRQRVPHEMLLLWKFLCLDQSPKLSLLKPPD